MKYQLVLQFTVNSLDDFDELRTLEDELNEYLGTLAAIDGHDCGASESNIFVLTDEPAPTFEKARRLVGKRGLRGLRAAYRELTGGEYVILWPPTLTEFSVS